MFRRRGRDSEDGDPVAPESPDEDVAVDDDDEGAAAAVDVLPAETPDPRGPWDVEDAPEDDIERLDLGGMLVPALPTLELRVEVGPEGQVIAATVAREDSALQINAFAAPRSAGIWDEICQEILESLVENGGSGETAEGPFGLELRAKIPGDGRSLQPARFLGADGPRWFVRGLLSGPAATDAALARDFEAAFRAVIVVRGKDAMAPRDPLPLRLPTEAVVTHEEEAHEDGLNPFERGPEITEIH